MASPLKNIIILPLEERIKAGGCSHLQVVDFNDFADTAGTTKTLSVLTGTARQGLGRIFYALKTNFDGGATSELTVQGTLNYASSTDKVVLPAHSIHEDATEVVAGPAGLAVVDASTTDTTFGAQELAVLDSLRLRVDSLTGRVPIIPGEAWTLDFLFTSTGANLNALTSGKLQLFIERIDLNDFDQVVA
jgi:hypothetical protein